MFEVKDNGYGFFIGDGYSNYMHRDGEIIHACCEYWPDKGSAQAVLDKWQPSYVWKHGDIAISGDGQRVFIEVDGKLRLYDKFGQTLSNSANVQHWANQFGYKKIGNVFGFGL